MLVLPQHWGCCRLRLRLPPCSNPGSSNRHVPGSGKSNGDPHSAGSDLRHWQIKRLAQRKSVGKLKLETSCPEARIGVSATGTISHRQGPVRGVNNSSSLFPQPTGPGEGETFPPKYPNLLYCVVLGFLEGEEERGRAVKRCISHW